MRLSPERRASLEKSTARYEQDVGQAAHYLAGRGLTEATARSFRLGVVHEPLPGDEPGAGRLSIPYLTRAGVVAVRYRCLQAHEHDPCPKYWGYPGAASHLFNVGALFGDGDLVCVTEGELDTIVLAQVGLASVGVPGGSNWKPHYSRIFEDFRRVVVFADGDDAGVKFGRKVAEAVHHATVVAMPPGLDVNDAFLHPAFGKNWLMSKTEG